MIDRVRHVPAVFRDVKMAPPALLPLGLLLLVPLGGIVALGDLRQHLPLFVLYFFAAWVVYLAAVWLVCRGDEAGSRAHLFTILAIAFLARLLMVSAAPTLSDDLYRYVWEATVLTHGLSPYALSPDAPVLIPLRDAIWTHVNNRGVPSPYPPLAQLTGIAGVLLFPESTLGPKVFATIYDLLTTAVLCFLLARERLPLSRVLVYAWSPLVLIEFPLSGHNDAMMLFLLLAALLVGYRRPVWAGVLLGLAALAKITPLLALPVVWRRWGVLPAMVAGMLFVGSYAPVLLLGGALGSLPRYLVTFADNDSIHAVIREVIALINPARAGGVAKIFTFGLLLLGIGVVTMVPRYRQRPLWWQVYAVLALSLLLSSTVHAWYVVWLLPFVTLTLRSTRFPGIFRPCPSYAWLLFSGLVVLPYLTYRDYQWHLWISLAEYVPLYLLFIASVVPPRTRDAHLWPSSSHGPGSQH